MNWIVSELFYPDEVSTAKIMTDIAIEKSLYSEVGVICGPSGYEKSYSIEKRKISPEIYIVSIKLPNLNKNNLYQRVIRLLLLTFKMSWAILLKIKSNDKVLITTNPAFLLLTIVGLKKIKSFRLEILVHDVFPENLLPAGLIRKNSLRYYILKKLYNNAYKSADRIIVLGEDMKKLMIQKLKFYNRPIDIIPNWHDDDINPIFNFSLSNYLGVEVKDKIVIGFAGNLGRLQGVIEFLDLFKFSQNPNIILVIVGDGAMRDLILKKIENDDLKNILFLGPKPRNEQNFFLNACHIGLITLIQGMKGLGVPSKTYNLMAAGKPLFYIGDKFSELDNYINKYDCGWAFDWDSKNEIINFLKSLSIEKLDLIAIKSNNSQIASSNFKREKILKLF